MSKSCRWKTKEILLALSFRWFHKFLKYPLIDEQDSYFWGSKTIVHVGAHLGEERLNYLRRNVTVYWIEAVPEIFEQLQKNLRLYTNQFAFNHTLADTVGSYYELNIANQTACSSILDIKDEKALPEVSFVKSIGVFSMTLDELIDTNRIILSGNNLLLIDAQGAELLVLKGCRRNLKEFETVIVEAQDFELYDGQSKVIEIENFLREQGYACVAKTFLGEFGPNKRGFELFFKRSIFKN